MSKIEIDVLVPILGRSPLKMLASLAVATTTPYRVLLICSPGDSMIEVCRKSGHRNWVVEWEPERADFAKKINWGYENTSAPWIFQGADDIRFSPGWDVEALEVAERTGAQVIGTNDLHNPSVIAGKHATHSLFARSYIETYGGTYDKQQPVFSEAYDHSYVDNELVDLAIRRRKWAFAEKAIVEHLHPVWGHGQWDDTHKKAFRDMAGDARIFIQRSRRLGPRAAR